MIEKVLFCLLFFCWSTQSAAALLCQDVCNASTSFYLCGTFANDPYFLQVDTPNWVWFSAALKNGPAILASASPASSVSLTFSSQTITVGGSTWNPPNSVVTINSGGSSSTSFSSYWDTTAGSGCGDIMFGGLAIKPSSNIPTTNNFKWCGVITSSVNIPDVQWYFGAAAYTNFSTTHSSLGVRSSSSISCAGSDRFPNAAGQPQTYMGYYSTGGSVRPESVTDPVGDRGNATTDACFCPTTVAPTTAPTVAPTRAPTNAPTVAPTRAPTNAPTAAPTRVPTTASPTNAPTVAPTKAPTNAPTAQPTNAPTPPTDAPTRAPTRAPTNAPTRAPTNAPTAQPTNAPTPPTDAPTRAPTRTPTVAPTRAPTNAPTARPTSVPTPPTDAPTRGPTRSPTNAPTRAPTNVPTPGPTNAPTPPTEAPTRAPSNAPTERPTRAPTNEPTGGPTRAPTPPTEAPTVAPTNAPTERPTRAPTNEPTGGPTRAPTPPTEAPTVAPTNAPTERPTRAPTPAPTVSPTRAPTPPTNAPTGPPTNRPTRAPTPPTLPPPTKAPTTAAPTAPVDPCTRQFTAQFTLTYDQMTNGYVKGTLVYDYPKNVLAFYYTNQSYQEIYKFNNRYGYGNTNNQEVYRISENGTCAPCSRYQNQWGFPVFWNVSGVASPYPTGEVDSNGCINYTLPTSNNNWAQYFGVKSDGSLCYIANQGRLFTIDSIKYCDTYDPSYVTPPPGCTCNTPQDIVFSLDRSSSIRTSSTFVYREFLQQFVNSYVFDPTQPTASTQMGIVQWGNIINPTAMPYPIGNFGSIPFTMDPVNINAAVQNVGCTGVPCNFCNGNPNSSYCIYPTVYKTCTSCGLYGAGKLFTDTNYYKKRATSSQVIIVITDGNANTLNSSWSPTGSQLCCGDGNPITAALVPGVNPNCDDGNWQTYAPLGCFTDIDNTKQQVMAMVPGVTIFAIGVGPDVNLQTLQVIANGDNNAFVAPDFETLLSQIQSIVTLTCVEPHPITSCGTGESACGFCACGQTKLPDGIIPANLCDSVTIVPQSQCYTRIPVPLNCTKKPCETASCDPTLNNGTGGCIWGPTVCNQPDPCYIPACVAGVCIGKAVCNTSIIGCCPTDAPTAAPTDAPVGSPTVAPTPPTEAPTIAPECLNSTAGFGCGKNGICNKTTGLCECIGGFHGALCQFQPGEPECLDATVCDDSDPCTTDICDPTSGLCVNNATVCDDFNACTLDFCNASGCQHVPNVPCDDGNGCTEDYCNITDGLCYHISADCSNLTDVCNIGYCDPVAPKGQQCFQQSVTCQRANNCSIAFCLVNQSGCTNQTLDCSGGFVGVVAGITAGVIAAIAAAGAIACAGMSAGGAYAVANNVGQDAATEVLTNPIYQGDGFSGDNPLFV